MQATYRHAAELLRSRLISGRATPLFVQASLDEIAWDQRDAWLDWLWGGEEEIPLDERHLPRGCVPYLPCPVATVTRAVHEAKVTSNDVFVDIGSGVGRSIFLVHALTGADCVGIEIQPRLVESAMRRAAGLQLQRTRFIQGDAVEQVRSMTTGTVFFLYCPFSGERLDCLLDVLQHIAQLRRIRVCCVHLPPLERAWLMPIPCRSAELHIYQSTA